MWLPNEDADALVESAMVSVQLDGADIRCPWQVLRLFAIRIEPIVSGPAHGQFDLWQQRVLVKLNRCPAVTRWRLAHEVGHLVLCLNGILMPHDESLASRCGRAVCLSRSYILRALDGMSPQELAIHHSEWLPLEQVTLRVWEVRQSVRRMTG